MTAYRTAFGSHRHASYSCANSFRAIGSGDPVAIPAGEVADWAPCTVCNTDAEITAAAVTAAAQPVKVMCPNSGVKRPGSRRLYDDCKDCGKNGKVTSQGVLKAHAPQH
jgi:hypothetical protein